MSTNPSTACNTFRKYAINLAISNSLVKQAETCLVQQQQDRLSSQQEADAAAGDWNTVHAAVGSFADEHSNL